MNRLDQINEKKKQLRDEILQYLIDHPNAQDTVTGIVTWWFLQRTIKPRTALVEEVLKKLVADGLIIAHKGSDSQTRYKINRRRRKEIISFLQQRS
jgi:Fe2+ or Zn2+ uptake regulation protein